MCPRDENKTSFDFGNARDDLGRIDVRLLQLNAAAGDAGDIQQVVDEAFHQRGLLANDFERFVKRGFVRIEQLRQLAGVGNRGERVSQLVTEHRQELVFAPLAVANGLKELRVVERGGGPARRGFQ